MITGTRNFSRAYLLLLLIAGTILPSLARAEFEGDVRLWQTLGINFYENADWRVTTGLQSRLFDEGKYLGSWLLFPAVDYKIHPNLDLGTSYVLQDIRAEAGDDYTRLHGLWLYLSPHWQITDALNFSMRHAMVYRAVESQDNYWVSRHTFAVNYKLKDCGRLIGIGASTELFYNYETDRLFENRFIPISTTFKLTDNAKLSLYLMAQSKCPANTNHWDTAYIFGQSISYKW